MMFQLQAAIFFLSASSICFLLRLAICINKTGQKWSNSGVFPIKYLLFYDVVILHASVCFYTTDGILNIFMTIMRHVIE